MKITVDVLDERMLEIIDPEPELELYHSGLEFTEGPVWYKEGDCFIFNDIPSSRTFSWSKGAGLRLLFNNGTKSNGMYLGRDGKLLICEHATSSVVSRDLNGTRRKVLADYYGDIELNSPNDIVERSDGLVYFTDPIFGRTEKPSSVQRPIPSKHRAVYMYDPASGELSMVADGYTNPNGLCFSEDEKTLYVNDSEEYLIKAYDVLPFGELANERVIAYVTGGAENHCPDGLKLDSLGNVVCAGQNGGVYWFDKDGKPLGIVHLDQVRVVNFCWGGEDGKTMFLTCAGEIYGLHTKVTGCKYFST